MNMKINVGIVGYGNLGKALEEMLLSDKNFNLVKIFSRRENLTSKYGTGFDRTVNLEKYKNIY